jgi:transposase
MTPLEAKLTQDVERLTQENKLLRDKVDLLVRRIFGAKSEQLDEAQLMLLLQGGDGAKKPEASGVDSGTLEAEIAKGGEEATRHKGRSERETRMPQHLPAQEEIIDPVEVRAEPERWRQIGEEVTEQLDYQPARFFRRRLIRRKYVRLDAPLLPPVIAPLNTLQERSIAAPGLLAQIIVGKYCDHLPLYRQEQIFARRHGIHIPRQSMARWMGMAADWLQLIYADIKKGVLAGSYVQVDETPIEYLSPGHGQTRQGYLWACNKPGGDVFFEWATSRAAACLDNIIPVDFTGKVQCDGYGAYPAFAGSRAGRIELAGCWAHVRRKFYEAKEQAPQHAGFILLQIKQLYRIERKLRKHQAGPRLRQSVRVSQSRMIVERLRKVLAKLKDSHRHLPQSNMGKAINYALKQWPQLVKYLEDGRVEIDNNLVENSIRPTAIGKKNWLFIGEAEAGQRGAILYTIIESCRARGIDPFEYLSEIFTRLPQANNQQVHELTPAAWAKRLQADKSLAA